MQKELKIIIFSTGRADNQITFNNIPQEYHQYTSILVYSDETEEYIAKNPTAKIVGVDRSVANGIAQKRKYAAMHCNNCVLFMLDDDLGFIKAKKDNIDNADNGPFLKFEPIDGFRDFRKMMNDILDLCDKGFKVGGLGQRVAPTGISSYPFTINSRVWTNTWFDFTGNHSPDQYDWTGEEFGFGKDSFIPEDFHIQAQVTEEGYPVVSMTKWNVNGNKTQAAGGCAKSRTVENHNKGMEMFTDLWNMRWKDCVKLRYKDSWEKDVKKAAITLYLSKIWKQNFGNDKELMQPWLDQEEKARHTLGGIPKDLAKHYEKLANERRIKEQKNVL